MARFDQTMMAEWFIIVIGVICLILSLQSLTTRAPVSKTILYLVASSITMLIVVTYQSPNPLLVLSIIIAGSAVGAGISIMQPMPCSMRGFLAMQWILAIAAILLYVTNLSILSLASTGIELYIQLMLIAPIMSSVMGLLRQAIDADRVNLPYLTYILAGTGILWMYCLYSGLILHGNAYTFIITSALLGILSGLKFEQLSSMRIGVVTLAIPTIILACASASILPAMLGMSACGIAIYTQYRLPMSREPKSSQLASSENDIWRLSDAQELSYLLRSTGKVIIIPGYGLAAAQAQHELAKLIQLLTQQSTKVRLALHPLAGRALGHMNILLAETDMAHNYIIDDAQEINSELLHADIALIIGANDIVNKDIPEILPFDLKAAKFVIVIDITGGRGYMQLANKLFVQEDVLTILGDARKVLRDTIHMLTDRSVT